MKAFGLTNRKIYKHLGGGLYCGKKNNFPKTTEKGKKSTKASDMCFVHPIFGFWFLVTFGGKYLAHVIEKPNLRIPNPQYFLLFK